MELEKTSNINKNDYDPNWLKGTSAESLLKSESSQSKKFSHPVYKKLSKLNGKINDMSVNELVDSLDELKLDTCGKKEVLIKRLKSHYKDNHVKVNKCKFDFIGVIDFEATCTEIQNKNFPHEIIEFPIVLIDMKTFSIVDHFSSYCKPVINPKLSSFCTQLTGITQDKVDNADNFESVLNKVEAWMEKHQLGKKFKFAVATDGPWDMQNFLNLQCFHSDLPYPHWAKKWIDVRKLFSNWLGVRRCNIAKMLAYYDLEFEGNPHCGLDDARNISRILIHLARDGCEIKINDHLEKCMTQVNKKNNELNEPE